MIYTTKLQCSAGSALIYKTAINRATSPSKILNLKRSNKKTYSGETTVSAVRRIRNACSLLDLKSEWQIVPDMVSGGFMNLRLTFITLSFPSRELIDHKTAYEKCLKPFLRIAREKFKMNDYIWKAELQKRGQIHYHITTNIYWYWKELRNEWNAILDKQGLLNSFANLYGHKDCNSTDIHKVYNESTISKYLEKYICKKDSSGRSINGKIWDCSKTLKGKKLFNIEYQTHHEKLITDCFDKLGENYYTHEHFTKINFKSKKYIPLILRGYEHELYREWLENLKKNQQVKSKRKSVKKAELKKAYLPAPPNFFAGTGAET